MAVVLAERSINEFFPPFVADSVAVKVGIER